MTPYEIATEWYQRAATVAHGHYRAAMRFSKLNFAFGFPSVVLATIVGTSVFATLQAKPEIWWQVTVGVMSIAAAILSALQSFLGYNDKAEKHRTAGAKYNAIGRELELWLSLPERNLEKLDSIRQRIDTLAQESPHIPESVHKQMPKADRKYRVRSRLVAFYRSDALSGTGFVNPSQTFQNYFERYGRIIRPVQKLGRI